jgi:hypothetical protein
LAESDAQVTKEKTVAKNVKQRSANAKAMPAPEVQLKRLTTGLKLTAEQQKQISPMLRDEYAALKGIRQDENLSPKQIQVKVEALRKETKAKIQTVLTPEQIEKHNIVSDEIKANKQKRVQENRRSRLGTMGDPPPAPSKP